MTRKMEVGDGGGVGVKVFHRFLMTQPERNRLFVQGWKTEVLELELGGKGHPDPPFQP